MLHHLKPMFESVDFKARYAIKTKELIMKYVVLSFDDARSDFYDCAFPILKEYGLVASLNVIPSYVGMERIPYTNYKCMTWEEIVEVKAYGIEITNHSYNHTNNIDQIIRGGEELNKRLGNETRGFVSPGSYVCKANFGEYQNLISNGNVEYIRSGNQIRRDGFGYAFIYKCACLTKSRKLFYYHNKRFIINLENVYPFFPSIMVNRHNSFDQIHYMITNLQNDNVAILMLHSVEDNSGFKGKKDKWTNSVAFFEKLCNYLASEKDISVITNRQLFYLIQEGKGA